jgi:hypothetical protein
VASRLANNILTGTVATVIGGLNKLKGLILDGNSFNGTIPSQMGLLTTLASLWLSNNKLSGTVPAELSSVSAVTVKLSANNLTGSLDMFCNKTDLFSNIDADCAGVDPAVECTFCTSCCDLMSGVCTGNVEAVCLFEEAKFENENGPLYYKSGGTVCECTSGSDGNNGTASVSCMDTQCQSCNANGAVCSMNKYYQISFDENGYPCYYHMTFQDIVGQNDTVTLEYNVWPNLTREYKATVNGQVCNSCFEGTCADQFLLLDCKNVEGAGAVDLCSPKPEDTNGPLAVFAFQDPVLLQGCPPRLFYFY